MQAKVLTTASTVECPHGFSVTFPSAETATLRVAGSPVVRSTDLATAVIACTVQVPCISIALFETSATLLDGSTPVVLVTGLATNNGECSVPDVAHDLLRTDASP